MGTARARLETDSEREDPMMTLRRRSTQRGNSVLELALTFTPLFALMLGIFELALPIFKKSTFSSAVREGYRFVFAYQTSYAGTSYPSRPPSIKAGLIGDAVAAPFPTEPR